MNPNSQHQTWSLWTFTVTPGDKRKNPSVEEVKLNCWRFAIQPEVFGKTGQMHVERCRSDKGGWFWIIKVRVEGGRHPAYDKDAVHDMTGMWARFFREGFGAGTHTHGAAKHEAGDRQEGKPADQLIIMPPVNFRHLAGLDN